MKKLLFPALVILLVAAGCGPADTTAPLDQPPGALSASDRTKFIGDWSGMYGCESIGVEPMADTMSISPGAGDLDFVITLHASMANPATVDGTLTDVNVITVPEQEMGGAPCTAEITYSDGMLTLSQSGLGEITCEGEDYTK